MHIAVYLEYIGGMSQPVGSSPQGLYFYTKLVDTGTPNYISNPTGDWKFYVPVAGLYHIAAYTTMPTLSGTVTMRQLNLLIDGNIVQQVNQFASVNLAISVTLQLAVNQLVAFTVAQDSGSPITTANGLCTIALVA
jgi:hypothetical protein